MPNIANSLNNYIAIKERLLIAFPELAEDDQALIDTLDGETDLTDAIITVLRSADDDKMLSDAIDNRIAELKARKDRLEARYEKKRDIVAQVMDDAGRKRIVAPDFTVTLSDGQRKVVIVNETMIPKNLMVTPEPPPAKPDKKAIGTLLKSEEIVPGCVLSNPQPHLIVRRT